MVRVLGDGAGAHRLEDDGGRVVGWIRGRVIGFRGFAGADVPAAAERAWRALDGVLRREYAGWPRREPLVDDVHLAHDGTSEWVTDGRTPLARVLRPADVGAPGSSVAIEFTLPSFASEGVAISAAMAMATALRRGGPPHDTPPDPLPPSAHVGTTLGAGEAA